MKTEKSLEYWQKRESRVYAKIARYEEELVEIHNEIASIEYGFRVGDAIRWIDDPHVYEGVVIGFDKNSFAFSWSVLVVRSVFGVTITERISKRNEPKKIDNGISDDI